MTDVHRRFLQLLMTHGVLEEGDVRRLQNHCYRVHDREYRLPAHDVPRSRPLRDAAAKRCAPLTQSHASPGCVSHLVFSPFLFIFLRKSDSPGDGSLDFEPE